MVVLFVCLRFSFGRSPVQKIKEDNNNNSNISTYRQQFQPKENREHIKTIGIFLKKRYGEGEKRLPNIGFHQMRQHDDDNGFCYYLLKIEDPL